MELRLDGDDYAPDGFGGIAQTRGGEALLQRVLLTLRVRRSSFPPLPDFGSRLHLLTREKPLFRETAARSYIEEAISIFDGLRLDFVSVTESGGGLRLDMRFSWRGESLAAALSL